MGEDCCLASLSILAPNPVRLNLGKRCAGRSRATQIIAPLIEMICPEMKVAWSVARKATRSATSSGWPARCIGTSFLMASASKAPSLMSVAMMPGATALTVMPRLARMKEILQRAS